jgi:DNA-directed RNA polymerase specialized sigma24 family protein
MKEAEVARDYKTIREDYRYDGSIFSEEPERVARLKWIIDNRLTEVERIIILLYIDCHSCRKLAKKLTLSHNTVAKEVRRIRAKILEEYKRLENNDR